MPVLAATASRKGFAFLASEDEKVFHKGCLRKRPRSTASTISVSTGKSASGPNRPGPLPVLAEGAGRQLARAVAVTRASAEEKNRSGRLGKWNLERKSRNVIPATMAWSRMRFKDQMVWVNTDEQGRLVLDSDGRAEMKYREGDQKTYRPSPRNLVPAEEPGSEPPPRQTSSPGTGRTRAEPRESSASGDTVHVWTDGACSGNPGPMGIGVLVIAGDKRKEHGEFLGRGTNNIAELTAIRRGLEIAASVAPGRDRAIRVYSDSSYAIGLLSQGWKPKANQELVAELRQLVRRYPSLRMVKVEGHAGVPENERCDLLARQAIALNR
jgi:ribonuclease HI